MNATEKEVYVVWRNTDLTEGRGEIIPYAVCWKQSTAIRLAWRIDVQRANGTVNKAKALKVDGIWYAPVRIIDPNSEDDANEERRQRQERTKEKMLKAGISQQEIDQMEKDIKDAHQA